MPSIFDDSKCLHDQWQEHPEINGRAIPVKPEEVPEPALRTIKAISDEFFRYVQETEHEEFRTPASEYQTEISEIEGGQVFTLDIHDPNGYMNPTGNTFFIRATGEYIGWLES